MLGQLNVIQKGSEFLKPIINHFELNFSNAILLENCQQQRNVQLCISRDGSNKILFYQNYVCAEFVSGNGLTLENKHDFWFFQKNFI